MDMGGGGGDDAFVPVPPGVGQVAYRLMRNNHVYRVAASDPPVIEDVSATLDAASPGSDSLLSVSPDGKWAAVVTTRFGCDFDCLVLAPIANGQVQGAQATRVLAAGQMVHPQDRVALSVDANLIVYTDNSGPHTRDQFAIHKSGDGSYGAPVLLTGASTFAFNLLPSLAPDGSSIVFDASADGGANAVTLCRVGTDGSGFAVALSPAAGPNATASNEVHSGNLAADGTLVFESDWNGERIWQRAPAGALTQIGDFNDDNTPCLLPDGRIASLWLNRPGGGGMHELKIMPPDGSSYRMLVENEDILDIGLSCGE